MDQDPKMQGTQPEQSPTPSTEPGPAPAATAPVAGQTTVVREKVAPVTPMPGTAEPVSSTPAPSLMPPTEPVTSPKPKRTGLLVAIILLVIVLLGGIGAAVWYFAIYNSPAKVIYDAVTGFLEQPNLVSNGSILAQRQLDDDKKIFLAANIDSKTNGQAGENAIKVKVALTDDSEVEERHYEYEIEAGSIVTSDGTIYLRVNSLIEMVDQLLIDTEADTTELGEGFEIVYGLLGEVDGEWWQIKIPDLIDELVNERSLASPTKELYACLVEVSHQNVGAQLAEVYGNYQFVNIEKLQGGVFGGNSTYRVSLDYDLMADFMNSTLDIEAGHDAEKCLKTYVEAVDGTYEIDKTYVEADELEEAFADLELEMTISNFGHELQALGITTKNLREDEYTTIGLNFTHPEVEVTAPTSYRPITELAEKIVTTLMEYYNDYYGYYDDYFDDDVWYDDDWYDDDYEYDFDYDYDWDDDWYL